MSVYVCVCECERLSLREKSLTRDRSVRRMAELRVSSESRCSVTSSTALRLLTHARRLTLHQSSLDSLYRQRHRKHLISVATTVWLHLGYELGELALHRGPCQQDQRRAIVPKDAIGALHACVAHESVGVGCRNIRLEHDAQALVWANPRFILWFGHPRAKNNLFAFSLFVRMPHDDSMATEEPSLPPAPPAKRSRSPDATGVDAKRVRPSDTRTPAPFVSWSTYVPRGPLFVSHSES